MKFHRLAAVGVAGLATVLAGSSAAVASNSHSVEHASTASQHDSLRELATKINLRVGVAVNMSLLNTDSTYTDIVANQFSTVTPENVMKWDAIEPTQGVYNWGPADQLVAFAQAHHQLVRGHTLMWHNQLPSWLTTGVSNGTISDSQLREILKQHVMTEVGHFKGKIWAWDVANEVFANAWDTPTPEGGFIANDFWIQHLGAGILGDVFRWAHEADPHAILFYNDYNIAGEDGTNAKADAVYAWAQKMLKMGVPLMGIGDQGHLDTQYGFSGSAMQADLQRYADLGLKVAITEADVRTFVDDPSTQNPTDSLALFAQPFEFDQMMKACLFVKACISFTIWDVADSDSWVPGVFAGEGYPTLYDVNYQPKTAYYTLQQDLKLAAYGAPHRSNNH